MSDPLQDRRQSLARAHLAAIVESSEDAIVSKDLNGIINSWNAGAQKLFGYTPEEAIGRPVTMLIPPERIQEETSILSRIRAGERVEHFETVRMRKDGSPVHVSLTISPVKDDNGVIVGASKIARDITERRAAMAELAARELQLRLLTENAPVLLAHTDRHHRYKFVNRNYAERFGRTAEEMIGLPVGEVIGPEAWELIRRRMDRALKGPHVEYEIAIPYSNLGKRWMHIVCVPETNPAGEVIGVVTVLTDITARKQAEDEVARARDEAVAASRAKDDFLAALSHELRTPLNPVLLLASEGAANEQLPAAVRADFDMIAKNVALEARLIDDLLDLTRITRGRLSLEYQVHDIHRVLKDAIAIVMPDVEDKKIAFIQDFAAPRSEIYGDAVRLQQVLWNVLKNAVKFTPRDGRIEVRTAVVDGNVTISVKDSGIGLTADEMTRAFDSFAQGEHAQPGSPHRFGGLGLGLAISRALVERHGGSIHVESRGRGHGAVFTVELPLHRAARRAPPAEISPPEATASPPEAGSGRKRILLVEDHEPTRATLAMLLRRRGYEPVDAATAGEARQAAARGRFAMVISDIGLPDGSGYDLMRDLREQYGMRGIALSGYGMESDVERSRAAGFIVHLTKPIKVQSLENALATLEAPAAA